MPWAILMMVFMRMESGTQITTIPQVHQSTIIVQQLLNAGIATITKYSCAKVRFSCVLPQCSILPLFNVAKYHLGKVKLELMQLASVPNQLMSVRQVNMSLCSQGFSPLGVRDLWGGLQGFCRGLGFIAQLL